MNVINILKIRINNIVFEINDTVVIKTKHNTFEGKVATIGKRQIILETVNGRCAIPYDVDLITSIVVIK
jgi:hypothetical protein